MRRELAAFGVFSIIATAAWYVLPKPESTNVSPVFTTELEEYRNQHSNVKVIKASSYESTIALEDGQELVVNFRLIQGAIYDDVVIRWRDGEYEVFMSEKNRRKTQIPPVPVPFYH